MQKPIAELIHCWSEQLLQPIRTLEHPNSTLENYPEMIGNMDWLNQLCDTVKLTHKHLPHLDEQWKCSFDLEINQRKKVVLLQAWEFNFSVTVRKPNMFVLSLKMPPYNCRRIFNSHPFLIVAEKVSRGVKYRAGWIPLISITRTYRPLWKVLFSFLSTLRLTKKHFFEASVKEVYSTLV